jgi:hypothetical protein
MNTNIELIQYQLQQKLILDEKRQYDLELLRLAQNDKQTMDDKLNVKDLETKIDLDKQKLSHAMAKADEAEHMLQSNKCEEPSPAPSPASSGKKE